MIRNSNSKRRLASVAERVKADAQKGLEIDTDNKIKYSGLRKKRRIYQFKEDINWDNFFFFDKKMITEGIWQNLGKAAKAVLPVIASYFQPGKPAYPSQTTIAILSGYSVVSVRKGIEELKEISPMGFREVEQGHYTITIPSQKGKFPFYKSVFESGAWRKSSPSAKTLYPVLRTLAHFNTGDMLISVE